MRSFARLNAGRRMVARTARIAITVSNSSRVNPRTKGRMAESLLRCEIHGATVDARLLMVGGYTIQLLESKLGPKTRLRSGCPSGKREQPLMGQPSRERREG